MTPFRLKQVLAVWDARELDLKWALVGRIALIAILCAAGAAAYAMHDVAAKTRHRNAETADEVHKQPASSSCESSGRPTFPNASRIGRSSPGTLCNPASACS